MMELDRTNDGPGHIATITRDERLAAALGLTGRHSDGLYEYIADAVNRARDVVYLKVPLTRSEVKRGVMTLAYSAGVGTVGAYVAQAGGVRDPVTAGTQRAAGAELIRIIKEALPGFDHWARVCKTIAREAARDNCPVLVKPCPDATVRIKYSVKHSQDVRTALGRTRVEVPGPTTRAHSASALPPNVIHALDGAVCAAVVARHVGPVLSVYDAWLVSP